MPKLLEQVRSVIRLRHYSLRTEQTYVSWIKQYIFFTRAEIKAILAHLSHPNWLMASRLYGAGLRLKECLTLPVKDLDFEYRQNLVRDAKGGKDRRTMLPTSLIEPLRQQLSRVRALHQRDLREGFGSVHLPTHLLESGDVNIHDEM